ncbi:MAG TPA: hypothetical protein VMZ28_20745 [Kofleriaceae bacterium]|nr:hypothetical protein [Kofleriaceae bacterium]
MNRTYTVALTSSIALLGCAISNERDLTAPDKSAVQAGKADGVDMCAKFGFPAGCDLCAEFEWYGDGECDQSLFEAGVCALPDTEDCAAPAATAFRMTTAALADPHVFADLGGCADLTDFLNGQLADKIEKDDDGDGDLDLSLLDIFRPLAPGAPTAAVEVGPADCAAPAPGGSCVPDAAQLVATTATQKASGSCLGALAGTAAPDSVINTATAPCYATGAISMPLTLGSVELTLTEARLGGTFAGGTTRIDSGLARGFVSEAQADATILPDDLPIVGGRPLSSLLPGGTDSCQTVDGRDVAPDGTTRGWYFYINFTARTVTLAAP